jgi:hypothetical protein
MLARLVVLAAFKAAVAAMGPGGMFADFLGSGFGAAKGGFLANDVLSVHQGGQVIRRYSLGGPVLSNGDSVPALLTPGEFVVSRQGVDALSRINQGQVPSAMGGDVTVNIVGSGREEKPTVNVHRQFGAMVVDVIWANVRQNGSLRQLFAH